MNDTDKTRNTDWFAIKTRHDFRAEEALAGECEEVFFPKERVKLPTGRTKIKAVIPHVLFIKSTREKILDLEAAGRKSPESNIPFWIYRYPKSSEIQVIPPRSIELLKLLTTDDTTKCRIYTAKDFKINERVRVIGGIYQGYEGFVKRIEKNKHVVVSIEGVCLVILPFIHPDLLERL